MLYEHKRETDELNAPEPQADSVHSNDESRFVDLESRYTHLQRVVDDLNQVTIEQARRIEMVERRIQSLLGQLAAFTDRSAERGNIEEEKPPHY